MRHVSAWFDLRSASLLLESVLAKKNNRTHCVWETRIKMALIQPLYFQSKSNKFNQIPFRSFRDETCGCKNSSSHCGVNFTYAVNSASSNNLRINKVSFLKINFNESSVVQDIFISIHRDTRNKTTVAATCVLIKQDKMK